MNSHLFIIAAILTLTIANIFKIFRLAQFIEPYEKPNYKKLTQALALGNLVNIFAPFRLGYLLRVYIPGKHMKNGFSFSLATIIVEIIIDFILVSLIYIIFFIFGFDSLNNIIFYLTFLTLMLIFILLIKKLKPFLKKIIYKIASTFNKNIELKILKLSWFTIMSFENILSKVNKLKLIIYSLIVWIMNILSCLLLTLAISDFNLVYSSFNLFFSGSGITSSLIYLIKDFNLSIILTICIYYVFSAITLFIVSYFLKASKKEEYIELLPQININDRLQFLELYFNNHNSNFFKNYLKLNSDVAVIKDYSAGSNATTILCIKNNQTFYRKYSFGNDALKLKQQIDWIHKYEKKISLTKITSEYFNEDICSYDMEFNPNALTCFNYVHLTPFQEAWNKLKDALNEIDKLHKSTLIGKANKKTIEQYINDKVLKNIEKIEKCSYIKNLQNYEYIYINGQKYHNLNYYKKYLNTKYLYNTFKNDNYSEIHGDFTIENIICLKNDQTKNKKSIYLIDPNTGNIHNSPYLDYAKLFQSLHGGYEFLMNTKNLSYYENNIEFIFTKSLVYDNLFIELVNYLEKKFGKEGLKSIFFHEIIHWLRLMPYKIEKDKERVLLFYAGLLIVAADIEKRFES